MTYVEHVPDHIKVNNGGPDRYDLECTVCHLGMDCGPRFGIIDGADLAASFVVDHIVHTAKGAPAGLTPTGKVSKVAREAIRDGAMA